MANSLTLPCWLKAAEEVAIIMPSEACVERIFALYTGMFNAQQQRALEDYKAGSVIIAFNEQQRREGR